jgi:hypothetical protein
MQALGYLILIVLPLSSLAIKCFSGYSDMSLQEVDDPNRDACVRYSVKCSVTKTCASGASPDTTYMSHSAVKKASFLNMAGSPASFDDIYLCKFRWFEP